MTTAAHTKLLQNLYRAFNARDFETILSSMHPMVNWPNSMEGGRIHGHSELREYWTRQWKLLDPRVDPVSVTEASADRTIVDVHQIVKDVDGNILLDQMVRHIYGIQDGLIERMDIEPFNS